MNDRYNAGKGGSADRANKKNPFNEWVEKRLRSRLAASERAREEAEAERDKLAAVVAKAREWVRDFTVIGMHGRAACMRPKLTNVNHLINILSDTPEVLAVWDCDLMHPLPLHENAQCATLLLKGHAYEGTQPVRVIVLRREAE